MNMHFKSVLASITMLGACLLAPTLAPAATPATIGDAQAEFSQGQYRTCLQKISQALTTDAGKTGTAGRYDLLMLRGECFLQLKEAALAADAFDFASRVVKSQGDLKRFAIARASAILIRSSPNLRYVPTTGKTEPIDLTAADSRLKAISSLFADRFASDTPRLKNAQTAASLPEIQSLLTTLGDLYVLEVATGHADAPQTLPIAQSIGQRARELLLANLDRIDNQIEDLLLAASEPVADGSATAAPLKAKGLSVSDREAIRNMTAELQNIEKSSVEGRLINRRLGGMGEAWAEVLSRCAESSKALELAQSPPAR